MKVKNNLTLISWSHVWLEERRFVEAEWFRAEDDGEVWDRDIGRPERWL